MLHTAKQAKYFFEVIRLFYEEHYSMCRISETLPVDRKTICRWITMYKQNPAEFKAKRAQEEAPSEEEPLTPEQEQIRELEKRIAELEVQLKYEKLRADFYSKMIDITESKFQIQIRRSSSQVL
jgi:predicted DNA-binding protein YlxM (UPF0122 family)